VRRQPHKVDRWEAYKKLRKNYQKACVRPTVSWRTFTADQVFHSQAARLNKILQRKAYNKLGLLTKNDGSLTENLAESYQLLMEEHFPGSSLIPEIGDDPQGTSDPLGADSSHANPVLVDELPWLNLTALNQAFKHLGKLKCPGPDGFRPIVL
jgi:hypothetical protein